MSFLLRWKFFVNLHLDDVMLGTAEILVMTNGLVNTKLVMKSQRSVKSMNRQGQKGVWRSDIGAKMHISGQWLDISIVPY
jgi:hypothetical protein